MPETEPKKVSAQIFETTHLLLEKEKTRRREEGNRVDFADLIDEATQRLLGIEDKSKPWSVWHEMLTEIFASVKAHDVPEKVSSEAVKAVRQNLRVFYRHIGGDPDNIRKS